MQYKAIFFDMDGTLTSLKTHKVPESAVEAMRLLKKRGVKIFLATGRHHLLLLNPVVNAIPFDAHLTANGQYCYNDREVIRCRPFPRSDKEALVKLLETRPHAIMFQTRTEIFQNLTNAQIQAGTEFLGIPQFPVKDAAHCLDQDVFEMLLFADEEAEREILQVMPGSCSVRWTPTFADLFEASGGKHNGIDALLDYYNIPLEETMAFGDSTNDLGMLQHVKLGIAMGNAMEEVKKAADYVTDTPEKDGIYNALKKFGVI